MIEKQHEQRQKDRLRFRSWHRGTREMDLLLGRFADAHLPDFTPAQVTQYEEILLISDPDLYNWIAGREAVPIEHKSEVMEILCAYYNNCHSGESRNPARAIASI